MNGFESSYTQPEKAEELLNLAVGRAEWALNGEDTILQNDNLKLFGVFDGLGGHGSGDVASQGASAAVEAYFAEHPPVTKETAEIVMKAAIESSGAALKKVAEQSGVSPRLTTASVLHFFVEPNGQTHSVYGHIGDSRIYENERFSRIPVQVTWDDATEQGYITRSVNASYVRCDQTGIIEVKSGDRFVICSDGVSGYEKWPVSDRFSEALRTPGAQSAAQALLDLGQLKDDKSVLVIDCLPQAA